MWHFLTHHMFLSFVIILALAFFLVKISHHSVDNLTSTEDTYSVFRAHGVQY